MDKKDFRFDRYARVPDRIWDHLCERQISAHAALFYVHLCGGLSHTSQAIHAHLLGKSVKTIRLAHEQLVEVGLIRRSFVAGVKSSYPTYCTQVVRVKREKATKVPQFIVKLKGLSSWDRVVWVAVEAQVRGQYKKSEDREVYGRGASWLARFLGRGSGATSKSLNRLADRGLLIRLEDRLNAVRWGIPNLREANAVWHKDEIQEHRKSTPQSPSST